MKKTRRCKRATRTLTDMNRLPHELLLEILQYLDSGDLIGLRRVNRSWFELCCELLRARRFILTADLNSLLCARTPSLLQFPVSVHLKENNTLDSLCLLPRLQDVNLVELLLTSVPVQPWAWDKGEFIPRTCTSLTLTRTPFQPCFNARSLTQLTLDCTNIHMGVLDLPHLEKMSLLECDVSMLSGQLPRLTRLFMQNCTMTFNDSSHTHLPALATLHLCDCLSVGPYERWLTRLPCTNVTLTLSDRHCKFGHVLTPAGSMKLDIFAMQSITVLFNIILFSSMFNKMNVLYANYTRLPNLKNFSCNIIDDFSVFYPLHFTRFADSVHAEFSPLQSFLLYGDTENAP